MSMAFSNTGAGPEWQLYSVNVKTAAEKLLTPVDFPPETALLAGFSIHPDGKRALTSIAKFPLQIWMLEGSSSHRRTGLRGCCAAERNLSWLQPCARLDVATHQQN